MSQGGFDEKEEDKDLQVKKQILERFFEKGFRIANGDLAECFGLTTEDVVELKNTVKRRATQTTDKPITYDYVFLFNVGENDKMRTPTSSEKRAKPENVDEEYKDEWENGVSQTKYYGQIIQEMKEDLEDARLTVHPFKSGDGKYIIFCVGITELALESWANDRDTDLLLDPTEACEEGRKKGFPLALRTQLKQTDDTEKCTLELANWSNIYAQYNPRANQKIYKHYHRIPGDEDSPMTVFDEKTRLRVIYEAIIADKGEGGAEVELIDHLNSRKHPLIACFPLHNQAVLDQFEEEWIKNCNIRDWMWVPLERIREYFGEPVAFYFAFMIFYLKWLIAPSIVGFIFFLVQVATDEIDADGIFLVSLFIIGWCVAFVDFWSRQEARFRLHWGMTKFEEKAVSRPQFKGEWEHDEVTGLWHEEYSDIRRSFKSTCTMSGIIIFLCCCVTGVVVILLFRDASPKDIELKIGLGVANGVMIFIFDLIYKYLSRLGNEWENHRTEQEYQDALITKSFFFKFFNSFSSLFYLAFIRAWTQGQGFYINVYGSVCPDCGDDDQGWDPDGICVGQSYDIRKGTKPSNNDFKKCCLDVAGYCSETVLQNEINDVILYDLQIQLASLFVTAIVIQNTLEVGLPFLVDYVKDKLAEKEAEEKGEVLGARSEAEEQGQLMPYENTIDDMAEIIIQFGYVTLFVLALPLTPLLALINNLVEIKVDGINLVKSSQRPHPNGSYGLGAWNGVLSFFSYIAVGTNVAIIVFRTSLVTSLLDSGSTAKKWIFFSISCIILALLVSAEKAIIPDVPVDVIQSISRQRIIESVLVQNAVVDQDDDEPPKTAEDDEDFRFDPSLPYVTASDLDSVPLGRLLFLEKERSDVIDDTPNNVTTIEP